jgi:hypothetical protein
MSQVGGGRQLSSLFAFLFLFLFGFFILNLPASLTLPLGRAWLSGYSAFNTLSRSASASSAVIKFK